MATNRLTFSRSCDSPYEISDRKAETISPRILKRNPRTSIYGGTIDVQKP